MLLRLSIKSSHIASTGSRLAFKFAPLVTASAMHSEDQATMEMDKIPEGFKAYKRTPLFTSENVPKTLLHRHNTKGGSWGMIHVTKGTLEYLIFGPPERVFTLTPGSPGIIKTIEYHKVTLIEPETEFHVEFYAENPDEAQAPRHVPTEPIVDRS